MDTLMVKVERPQKINYLIQILKSLDFVVSVKHFDKYTKAKNLLNEINAESSAKGLSCIKDKEIHRIIKSYRSGK